MNLFRGTSTSPRSHAQRRDDQQHPQCHISGRPDLHRRGPESVARWTDRGPNGGSTLQGTPRRSFLRSGSPCASCLAPTLDAAAALFYGYGIINAIDDTKGIPHSANSASLSRSVSWPGGLSIVSRPPLSTPWESPYVRSPITRECSLAAAPVKAASTVPILWTISPALGFTFRLQYPPVPALPLHDVYVSRFLRPIAAAANNRDSHHHSPGPQLKLRVGCGGVGATRRDSTSSSLSVITVTTYSQPLALRWAVAFRLPLRQPSQTICAMPLAKCARGSLALPMARSISHRALICRRTTSPTHSLVVCSENGNRVKEPWTG